MLPSTQAFAGLSNPIKLTNRTKGPKSFGKPAKPGTVYAVWFGSLGFCWTRGVLQGQGRAHQRPIQGLVDALRVLGARIHYLEREGYPPLRLEPSSLHGGRVVLPSNVSSQFASALLLGAVCRGVDLELYWGPEELLSRPYLDMTLAMLQASGWSTSAGPYHARLESYRAVESPVLTPGRGLERSDLLDSTPGGQSIGLYADSLQPQPMLSPRGCGPSWLAGLAGSSFGMGDDAYRLWGSRGFGTART